MFVYYSETENIVKVGWDEGKGRNTVRHLFSGEPSVLQLHPKIEKIVIRAYFDGKMPGWINDYQRRNYNGIKSGAANVGDGKLGWWISCWDKIELGHTMFMCPSISGAIHMLAESLPDEMKQYKDDLLSNIDIITLNLQFDANYFKLYGLHYRPEEIKGVAGALLIDNDVLLPKIKEESNQEYADRLEYDGNLKKLITEMIHRNEYAEEEESTEDDDSTVSSDSELEIPPVDFEDVEEASIVALESEEEFPSVTYEDVEEASTTISDHVEELPTVVYEETDDYSSVATASEVELPSVVCEDAEKASTDATNSGESVDSNITEEFTKTVATTQEVVSGDDTEIDVFTSTYKHAVVGQLSFF